MKYKAFISYKHHTSTHFASDLEYHLKKYAKGIFERPDRIFRDEQFLKPGGNLSDLIREALTDSEYLILLASPEAARSPWVISELKFWCGELGRADRLIIILTAGTIEVDSGAQKIIWKQTNALPPFLESVLPALPLFVDLSWASRKEERTLSNTKYKTSINSIVARLRNTTPNDLNGLEWKIRRRNLIAAWSLSFVLATLLVIVLVGFFTLRRKNNQLEKSIRLATSRELAAKSQLQLIPESIHSAVNAVTLDTNNESLFSFYKVMSDNQTLLKHVINLGGSIECLFQHKGKLIGLYQNYYFRLDWAGSQATVAQLPDTIQLNKILEMPTAQILGASASEIWDISSAKKLIETDGLISAFKFDTLSNQLYIGTMSGEVRLIDIDARETRLLYSHGGQVTDFSFGPGCILSTALSSTRPVIYYAKQKPVNLPKAPFSANATAMSPDFSRVAVAYENGQIATYDLPGLRPAWEYTLNASASNVAFSPDNKFVAASTAGGDVMIFSSDGDPIDSWVAGNGGVWQLTWIADTLITAGSDGWIRAWLSNTLAVPVQKLNSADLFYWHDGRVLGLDSNSIYDLATSEKIATLGSWHNDQVLDVNRSGVLTNREKNLYFYPGGAFQPLQFPASPDSLRFRSAAISEDGTYVICCWWPASRYSSVPRASISVWNVADNTVSWLHDVPPFAEKIAVYKNELVSAAGRGAVHCWDIKSNRLLSKSTENPLQPIEELAFLDENRLAIGYLLGKISVAAVNQVDSFLAKTEVPSGSIYQLEPINGHFLLSTDEEGAKLFDYHLNFLGSLINTKGHRGILSGIKSLPSGDTVCLRLRSGEIALLSTNLMDWIEQARRKCNPVFDFKKLKEKIPPALDSM